MIKPNYEHHMLLKHAIQAYISSQGLSYLDMNRESFNRNKHDEQMRLNMHIYDALVLLSATERTDAKSN